MARTASTHALMGLTAVVLAATALVGCHGSPHATPTPSAAPAVTASTTGTAVAPSPAAGATGFAPGSAAAASSSAAAAPVLPANCPELLPLPSVEQAIGAGLLGAVSYLKAAAVPQSGRTGRVTCGYGVPFRTPPPVGTVQAAPTPIAGAQPLLSASYITYVDAKTAASRVALTVQTDGAGAAITPATVRGLAASVLVGTASSELVMSDGARTIVLVASPEILTAAKAPAALEAMAAIMLRFGQPAAGSAPASVPASTAGPASATPAGT
jgi:hypothetical protein